MKTTSPHVPGPLRRTTSRTRTGREPVPAMTLHVAATVPESALYAGPPEGPARLSAFPGHVIEMPFAAVGVQVFAYFNPGTVPGVTLLLDLGRNRDLARIEMYGNLLLPPVSAGGKPVFNFGLPRSLVVAVAEEPFFEVDLHAQRQLVLWPGALRDAFHVRYDTSDLRALWGWTPIHLPPTYGRFIAFLMEDLPLVFPRRVVSLPPRPGLDIQRIVLYPFLEDVDHRPHVEYAPVTSRQSAFLGSSAYWQRFGVDPPAAEQHQSVGFVTTDDVLMLPSALVGLGAQSPNVGPVALYASEEVALDTEDHVELTVQATCDETPVLEGVRLHLAPAFWAEPDYQGPKLELPVDYAIEIYTTNDVEAAWSSIQHPSWALIDRADVRRPAAPDSYVRFREPIWARWVRLRARLRTPEGVAPGGRGRFLLFGLDLVRARDFWLVPERGEDVRVDHVLLRLYGPRLLDDYAFVDGVSGTGLTLEVSEGGGPFETLRCFRSLVDLLEDTHHRVFANHRRADKPVQRVRERTTSQSTTESDTSLSSAGTSEQFVKPEFLNMTVTRGGSLTFHTDMPRNNAGGPPLESLPEAPAIGVTTVRTFESDVAVPPPTVDFSQIDSLDSGVDQIIGAFTGWAEQMTAQGFPASVGFGLNLGAGGGLSAGLLGTVNFGVAVNAGTQLGGGVTKSKVEGSQGAVVQSEMWVEQAHQKHETSTNTESHTKHVGYSQDERVVERIDESEELRKPGLEVRHGGRFEDVVLVAIPVGRTLRGRRRRPTIGSLGGLLGQPGWPGSGPGLPSLTTNEPEEVDRLRLRVDQLPPDVRLDVEFRGRTLPHPEESA